MPCLCLYFRHRKNREETRQNRPKKQRERKQSKTGPRMVFNSLMVLSVAHVSADAWQYIACNPERLSSDQLLDLICCFPLQQLGRLALCLWTFLCLPPPDSFYSYAYYSSSSSSDDDDDDDDSSSTLNYNNGYYYHSHSD